MLVISVNSDAGGGVAAADVNFDVAAAADVGAVNPNLFKI